VNQQSAEQSPTTKVYPWDAQLLRRRAQYVHDAQDAHAALVQSEKLFRKLVQNSSDAITLLDAHGIVLFSNDGLSKTLNLPPEERIGRDVFQAIHPDDVSYARRLFGELLCEPGSQLRAQLRLRRHDGSWRWCDIEATNLLEEPGVRAVVTNARDVTDQKNMEEALRENEQRYRKLVEDATDAIFTVDLLGQLTSTNSAGEILCGYSRPEILCMNVRELAPPEDLAALHEAVQAQLGGGHPAPLELDLVVRGGGRTAIEVSVRLQFKNGVPAGFQGIARDISERKRNERVEHHRREALEMVAQNQPLEAVLHHLMEMIEHCYPETTACISLVDEDPSAWYESQRQAARTQGRQGHLAVPIRAYDGRVLGALEIYRRQARPLKEAEQVFLDGQAKLASIALEHRQITNRLAYQAQHDSLTGLPNRALQEDRLQQAIALARQQGKMAAVVYLDLDRFKLINDSLGHGVGDMLLVQAAQRLQSVVREADTLARTGGDEFTAVLVGIEDPWEVEVVGERLVAAMEKPFPIEDRELFVSVSVGIAIFPQDGDDSATLQKNADVAMYVAKSRGKNRFQRFSREMNSAASERLEIESHLHRALGRQELTLHYQPQFHVASGELAGMEALMRWNHPKWGLLLPGRFISLAEDSGLIIPMSVWLLDEACRQSRLWQDAGFPPVRIAVNVSALQFTRAHLVETVAAALHKHRIEPRFLDLELTEGMVMRDIADSAQQISALRDLGVNISIDDFGTGYSSLSYLQRLPIDNLKIDRCFVEDMQRPSSTQPLVQAVVGLAHSMSMTATAEGVETERELAVLHALGCDEVQGYLLGRPGPPGQAEAFLRARPAHLLSGSSTGSELGGRLTLPASASSIEIS
jgi:diguanylate cyclase (GGDEF)-like protein/PAS domain S-box-containing protein